MPGKSRRSRGKRSFQSKKGKGRLSPPVTVTQRQVVTPTDDSVPPKVSVPSARTGVMATLTATRYPYVLAELRRTGILAGVMLVILIVLALVFS